MSESLGSAPRLIRVFPRKTVASPDDRLAFFGPPPCDFVHLPGDVVHVSVAFKEDLPRAHELADAWGRARPVGTEVLTGGPAFPGEPGGDFVPGRYLKHGYVITSRGCPNNCWFCDVSKREGRVVRELPIVDGWNVLDSNILACSHGHILKVFEMLGRQAHRARFTGGLEAARLQEWHVAMLWNLRPELVFFAYDEPADLEPLRSAGRMMMRADFTRHHLRCYVLIGYEGDTLDRAEARLLQAWDAGFMPMAMLWSDAGGRVASKEWRSLQRKWARPALTRSIVRDGFINDRLGPMSSPDEYWMHRNEGPEARNGLR